MSQQTLHVHETETPKWRPTGILDSDGQQIFRYLPREPMGFINFDQVKEEIEQRDNIIG